ncbi:3-ketoacyl-ACP reductase [Paraburkholderia terrae]|uniref:3-ketoacyl-ACP reductase n=1 Tax=Paraburkholderia terrae TaxID=311230 RepID=UPI00296AD6F7|nr:3-ketoacyl-ACP reductase [Paraburkholderia terrae]MDW3663292.1 3-ketoacyl-ACP reductase [Paraburkholderia terrae]
MSKISGKCSTALVTGARRGIGRSICVALARRGFDIVLTDVVDDEDAATTCGLVRDEGQEALFIQSDLSDVASHESVVEEAVRFKGSLECLVNNAGIGSPSRGDLLDVSPKAFDAVLGVNLRGTFFMTQVVARHMCATSSTAARSIVTVSSVSADMASPERAEYCLSKSALPMMTRLFALRLASANVGVFEVRPGIIRTPMTSGVAEKYEARFREGLVPAGRWGESDEVGQAVATLASGLLPFATGSVVNVDGGLSIPAF